MENFFRYNFDISNIVVACFVPTGGGTPIHKNRPSHGLAFHTSGEKYYTFDGKKTLCVKANDIIYLPKNSNYVVEASVHGACYAVNFNFYGNDIFEPFVFHAKNKIAVLDLFKNSEQMWRNKPISYENKCKANLYNIISAMQTEHQITYHPISTAKSITPGIEYIHSHYNTENINISHLADICGISESYFRKLFYSVFAVSPKKYINTLRLNRAKELLESGMYSVSETAFLSGFFNESYFSREFKKYTGFSPVDYVKNSIL